MGCRPEGIAPGGVDMARYILKDDRYSKDPMVFSSYKEMIDRVRTISTEKGKEFTEKTEKELKYEVETLLE
jgi:hypothetical protein